MKKQKMCQGWLGGEGEETAPLLGCAVGLVLLPAALRFLCG